MTYNKIKFIFLPFAWVLKYILWCKQRKILTGSCYLRSTGGKLCQKYFFTLHDFYLILWFIIFSSVFFIWEMYETDTYLPRNSPDIWKTFCVIICPFTTCNQPYEDLMAVIKFFDFFRCLASIWRNQVENVRIRMFLPRIKHLSSQEAC